MLRRGWRRFRPLRRAPASSYPPGELYHAVEQEVHHLLDSYATRTWRRFDITILDQLIAKKKRQAEDSRSVHDWMIALILQAPRAVVAQRQMDKHQHGYHNQRARLYELIDFNDSFVSTVLVLPEEYMTSFQEELKWMMDRLCKRLKSPCFSDEQYEAITHGLSREIAVYRGAIAEGLSAAMTTRLEDAKGIDMVISDEESGLSINVDVKTRSAFYYRLKDLTREGRMTVEHAARADEVGYGVVTNGHDGEAVTVVLLRIDEQELGNIMHFKFENTLLLGQTLRRILEENGSKIRQGVPHG